MTRQQGGPVAAEKQSRPEQTPRLRLKPKAPITGYVDGAWWPHSDDLPTELPDLLAVLAIRLGPIDQVMFNLTEWAPAPTRLSDDRRAVRLAGYHRQPVSTIEVRGASGDRVVLLVVPAETDPDRAHDVMMAAATRNDVSTVRGLLATITQP